MEETKNKKAEDGTQSVKRNARFGCGLWNGKCFEGHPTTKAEDRTLSVKEVDLTEISNPTTYRTTRKGCALWSGHCSSKDITKLGCGLWNGDCTHLPG